MAALTIRDVLEAGARLRPTPLISYPLLNQRVGAEVFLKHENHQPIGSFKVRGALNALALRGGRLAVAASTGNHGQGVAYAARLLGMEAVIVVPERANREKTAAIKALGARVENHGQTLSDSQQRARELAEASGGYFAADGLEPAITAGAGTVALEIVTELTDVDLLVMPLGDGALAGGCGIVLRAVAPQARSLAMQSAAMPSMVESWRRGEPVAVPGESFADGLAVVRPHAPAVSLLRDVLDDALLVSEAELRAAIRLLLQTTHNLAEGAGAAALAGCLRLGGQLAGKKVAIILSGGNLDTRLLPEILAEG